MSLLLLAAVPAPAAPREVLVRLAAGGLAISAPESGALGSTPAGQTVSGRLGPVTVSVDSALLSGWTATVSLSAPFAVTQSGRSWTLPSARASYWSGAATATSGIGLNVCAAGQPVSALAQTMASTRTAYSCGALLSLASSLTWRPTVVVSTQADDPAGTYTGTITHSVA